jgi:hypothetical protein
MAEIVTCTIMTQSTYISDTTLLVEEKPYNLTRAARLGLHTH